MAISKLIQITGLILLVLITGLLYFESFENYESCIKKQTEKYNCKDYTDFVSKLDCMSTITKIESYIRINEGFEKSKDIVDKKSMIYKLSEVVDWKRKIRNLPYSFQKHFNEIKELALQNNNFYDHIFTNTYEICSKNY